VINSVITLHFIYYRPRNPDQKLYYTSMNSPTIADQYVISDLIRCIRL